MVFVRQAVSRLLVVASTILCTVQATPVNPSSLVQTQRTEIGESVFKLGNITYLAHLSTPKASFGCKATGNAGKLIPLTVIKSTDSIITGDFLESILANYSSVDDVYSSAFLEGVLLSSTYLGATIDASAASYLGSLNLSYLFIDSSIKSFTKLDVDQVIVLATNSPSFPPGPYVTDFGSNSVTVYAISRLYEDKYRDFLFGVYSVGDSGYQGLGVFNPYTWFPYIP